MPVGLGTAHFSLSPSLILYPLALILCPTSTEAISVPWMCLALSILCTSCCPCLELSASNWQMPPSIIQNDASSGSHPHHLNRVPLHPYSSWVYILTHDLPSVQHTKLMCANISDGQSSSRDSMHSQDKGTCWTCSLLHAFQRLVD